MSTVFSREAFERLFGESMEKLRRLIEASPGGEPTVTVITFDPGPVGPPALRSVVPAVRRDLRAALKP